MNQFQQPFLGAYLQQLAVQQVRLSRKGAAFLHPLQVILFRRFDGGVAQPLAVVARHHQLQGREKRLNELLLLVVQVLADALGHRHGGAFQFQHAQRDAVEVDHHIRPLAAGLGIGPLDRHFLGDGKVVVLRVLPVDQPDRDMVLTRAGLHLHAIAQQVIDRLVAVIEVFAGIRRRLVQLMQRPVDERVPDTLPLQPGGQQLRLDVAVVAVDPVAQKAVAQPFAEQRHDAGLGFLFDLADGGHSSHTFTGLLKNSVRGIPCAPTSKAFASG